MKLNGKLYNKDGKKVSMIRKYYNHKRQTVPFYREKETPERQTKQNNQLSRPYRDDCKTRIDTQQRKTKH